LSFAFIVVVLAAVTGLVSEVALRAIAPESASALALCVMASALLLVASRMGRKAGARAAPAPTPAPVVSEARAEQSLAPV
jgi:uncharacterized membrane protein